MSLVTTVLTAILSGYLAFTGSLADNLAHLLPATKPTPLLSPTDTPTTTLTELRSAYADIEQIWHTNDTAQTASAINALNTNTYAENPLDALVNIFCIYERGEETRITTGSGFFIDSDGVILTNAHVAQYLLLEELGGKTNCIIRTGNPAEPTFEVALLYISPAWILENADSMHAPLPRGTGERDYALLYVTAGIGNKPLPKHFASLPIYTGQLPSRATGLPIKVLGYPAAKVFASGNSLAPLIPKQASSTVTELMTFSNNQADVMAISGSPVGEQGASGGPIVALNNTAIGIISTRGDDVRDGEGSLRALSMSYIARTYQTETTQSLAAGISGDLPAKAAIFKQNMTPVLLALLRQEGIY
jgi:hypothetical protein